MNRQDRLMTLGETQSSSCGPAGSSICLAIIRLDVMGVILLHRLNGQVMIMTHRLSLLIMAASSLSLPYVGKIEKRIPPVDIFSNHICDCGAICRVTWSDKASYSLKKFKITAFFDFSEITNAQLVSIQFSSSLLVLTNHAQDL